MELRKHVEQITAELQQVLLKVKPMGNQWTVGEVMCSSNSPITQQVLRCGHSAFRFGLEQGDLATSTGRSELFTLVARHRPKHLWYSPTCGPWSSWSQLNASRSLHHQQLYQQMRKDLQYQIALGIVLYRHQMETGNHFHWEQPQKITHVSKPKPCRSSPTYSSVSIWYVPCRKLGRSREPTAYEEGDDHTDHFWAIFQEISWTYLRQ